MTKFIFTVGGVYSGTGKGVASAAIGLLLKMRGLKIEIIKFDPYLNTNAGTLSPSQHGESFVTDDGCEVDLDLGTYERLAGINVSGRNICTSGTVYSEIIQGHERGDYLGQSVQLIPHFTEKIHKRLFDLAKDNDIVIAEIGGTVGDDESAGMYEAVAQFKYQHPDDVIVIMVAPIIYNETVKEFKTKPLQNAVRTLRNVGIQPDILLCRASKNVDKAILEKISKFTYISKDAIFDAPDVKTIYQVPLEFYDRHVDDLIADRFHLPRKGVKIRKYRELVERYTNGHDLPTVKIGIVGKYDNCDEAYISLKEALIHAAVANDTKLEIDWINAEDLEGKDPRSLWRHFQGVHGIVVPGGFDIRGVEGKIRSIYHVREKKIPFLGICLGLQCAVIEFSRHVLGLEAATSEEFDKNAIDKVIHYIAGQENISSKSGTMRLGAYDCKLEEDSLALKFYKQPLISERHRHRYEVNAKYVPDFLEKSFKVTGKNPDSGLVEIMELDENIHPYFVGTQAHPEFKSRLGNPSPLFDGLIKAACVRMLSEVNETVAK